jgi:dTDP-glucose 4,6-dehydratase
MTGHSIEDSPFKPSNPYAASKAAADLLTQSYMRTHDLPLLIVRGSNNFGPYQYPEKLIPLAVTNILHGRQVPIHGDGTQKRAWLHVEDFCDGIDLVLHEGKNFAIYNISGTEKTNISVVKKICQILKKNCKDFIFFTKNRPGGDKRYSPEATRIKKELGWKHKRPIDKYLEQVVKWYLKNKKWWMNIKKKEEYKMYYEKQFNSEY